MHKIKDICAKANVPMAKAALSWVLQQNDNSCAIVGCQTPEQVTDNSSIVKLPQVSKISEIVFSQDLLLESQNVSKTALNNNFETDQ